MTSRHCRSDTSSPSRNPHSFRRTWSSGVPTHRSTPSALTLMRRSIWPWSSTPSPSTNTSTFCIDSRWMTLKEACRRTASRTASSLT